MALKRIMAFAAAGAVLATISGSPAQAAELTYGSWPPAASIQNRVAMPKIFKEIEEETKGEIKWKLVAGGQLGGPKESFQATSDNISQGALGIIISNPTASPSLNTIYNYLVFDGASSIQATPAALETMTLDCPGCLEEFKKQNLVPLAGWTTSQYYLACTQPFTKVEDLKGKRIRGQGGPAQLWEMAGAIPVSATLPEAVTLLQRGGLDCMHTTYTWLQTFGYGDFAKNVLDVPMSLSGPAVGLMLNRDTWNKFTPAQKTIHMKKAAFLSANIAIEEFTTDNQANLDKVIKEKGVKLIKVEEAGFKTLVEKFDAAQRATIIESSKKLGVKEPEKLLDAYKKNLEKWKGLTANVGTDMDKLADLIWTHIYSKVDVNKL
jgi:TRAP-type C4-dicarboxylate transport system substrate-binding protein